MVSGREVESAWYYEDRGWPFFEASVANATRKIFGSRLTFDDDLTALDQVLSVQSLRSAFWGDGASKSVSSIPLHPTRFKSELKKRVFSNGDHNLVGELYRRTFMSLIARSQQLDGAGAGWDDDDAEKIGEAGNPRTAAV